MVGKKYELAGSKFEVVGEQGEDWVIKIEGEKDLGTISKETLSDALVTGQAVAAI